MPPRASCSCDSEDDEGGAAEADEGGCDEEQQPGPTPQGGFSAADEQVDTKYTNKLKCYMCKC